MAEIRIPCPKCQSVLRLPNESFLGKTGKCPKCEHRFKLMEPEEIVLELVDATAEVPRKAIPSRSAGSSTAAKSPKAATRPAEAVAAPAADPPIAATEPFLFSTEPTTSSAVAGFVPNDAQPATATYTQQRKRGRRGSKLQLIVGGLVALGIFGTAWGLYSYQQSHQEVTVVPAKAAQNVAYDQKKQELASATASIAAESLTNGQPITLQMVPAGASVIFYLRPAELWKEGSIGQEVRYCLGPLAEWTATQLEKYALAPPQEIEEATICLMLGARGSPIDVACVAKYNTGRKRSDIIQNQGGRPVNIENAQLLVNSDRAFLFGKEADQNGHPLVMASAPAAYQQDLAASVDYPGLTSDDIRALLSKTDRQRHFTVLFQPLDLRNREEDLAAPVLRPLWTRLLEFFGDNVEAVCWTLHFTSEKFDSQLFVRPSPTRTPVESLRDLTNHLAALPGTLVDNIKKMNPPGLGQRKLIGRLPAMMQMFAASTRTGTDDRLVIMQSRLSERAAPNLAIASLLAWDESTRTDFSQATSVAAVQTAKKTLAERLKTPIDVDFRREPLEPAFLYIASEAKVNGEVDGEALKLAGYTKNMPQTYNLGKVPAEKALGAILAAKEYDKMCVAIDEKNDKMILTTYAAAKDQGLTPATFSP